MDLLDQKETQKIIKLIKEDCYNTSRNPEIIINELINVIRFVLINFTPVYRAPTSRKVRSKVERINDKLVSLGYEDPIVNVYDPCSNPEMDQPFILGLKYCMVGVDISTEEKLNDFVESVIYLSGEKPTKRP